jgi:hypothetical protein
VEHDALRDRLLAQLFVKCRWTQEKIAARMGQSQSWVALRLRFGRFFAFMTTGHKSESPPHSLTERRFRNAWREAKQGAHRKDTESDIFAKVAEILEAGRETDPPGKLINLVRKPDIKAAVRKAITGKARISTQNILAAVQETLPDTDSKQVSEALRALWKHPPEGLALESRHIGKSYSYRLVPGKGITGPPLNPEQAGAIVAEALPLLKECITILRAPIVGRRTTQALQHIWEVTQMLSRLLEPEVVA